MRTRNKPLVLPSIQAAGRGIVIQINADPRSTKAALEQIQQKIRETEAEATGSSTRMAQSFERVNGAIGHGVPQMAAASAGLRALEGNFTNNIRAGERFLTMIPGIGEALQTAFPYVGAVVLATALFKLGEEALHAFQNIVLLKGAVDSLNALDITVGKKVQSAADEAESSLENTIEKTQGKVAAMKQKLQYQSGKGIDLSDLFYDKNFSGLDSNIKANYETLYKSIAPADIPKRLSGITSELTRLHSALDLVKSGTTGAFVPIVGGFGPGAIQDPVKYYEARIKAAKDVQTLLQAENAKRSAGLDSTRADLTHDEKPKVGKSGNAIADAAAQLDQEQAKAAADLRKSQDQIQLAELEAQHKELLISDQAFYDEKLRLQLDEIDAEKDALTKRSATLQALYDKQHGDKLLKRDKSGNSAEELKTQRELLQIGEQIDALGARRGQATSQHDSETVLNQREQELATLKIAAELEKQRGVAIGAQIALIEREHELEAQKFERNGDAQGAADTRAAGQVLEQKLRIADVERQIGETENSYKLQAEAIEQRAAKGRESKLDAEHELNALHLQEAAALKALVDQYDALAATLGGPFKQKAAELRQELDSLGTPDRKVEAEFGKKLADGFGNMVTSITEKAAEGKESVAKMAQDILHDVENLALKLAEQKFILPLFENAFGAAGAGGGAGAGAAGAGGSWLAKLLGGGGGGSTGGGIGSAAAHAPASLQAPSIFTPAKQGGASGFAGIATDIAKAGATALTPKVTSNVINQSSQPVSSSAPEVSYDSELREFVIHTILTDHSEGGAISQIMGGN